MIPVDQTITTFENGNCFQACLASILEWELESIPNFAKDGPKGFADNVKEWAKKVGIILVDYIIENKQEAIDYYNELFKDAWIIATGKSPRGKAEEDRHCVVWYNGEMAHDPHPTDKQGLDTVDFLMVMVIKNPAGIIFNCKAANQG